MRRCNIAFETLADYHDGRTDAATSAVIRQHLETGCPNCQEGLSWLQGAARRIYETEQIQVPQRLLDRASALFRERFRPPVRVSWLARLLFDNRQAALSFAGARGASQESVQLAYSTDRHDIELFQEPTEEGAWYIIGQVMPKEGEATLIPREVVLTGSDSRQIVAAPQGEEFHLPSVPAGIYAVTLRLEEGDILLSDVVVGRQEPA